MFDFKRVFRPTLSKTLFLFFALGWVFGIVTTLSIFHFSKLHIVDDLEYSNLQTLPYKTQLLHTYWKYYNSTEELIDRLNLYNDTIMDEPVGDAYLTERAALESILAEEDSCEDTGDTYDDLINYETDYVVK